MFPVPPLSEDTKFFTFSAEYNEMLGRDPTALALRIFMRGENLNIARHLNEFVDSRHLLFYLQGPPGVGKTKESIIWMLQSVVNDSEGPWAWVPLAMKGSGNLFEVYLLDRSETDSRAVRYRVFLTSNLASDLSEWDVKLVVFDNGNQDNRGPIDDCRVIGLKTIAISSVQMKFDDSYSRHQAYTVNGWKEAEYREACEDQD
jgi:hypothetical protein